MLCCVSAAVVVAGCGGGSEESTTAGVLSIKTPPTRGIAAIAGNWRGRLHQKGFAPFTVTVTIASARDPSKNRVHYTGIDCSGHWTYLGRPNAIVTSPTYRFREVIDSGAGKACKGVGIVSLSDQGQPPGRLRYEFRGGGVVSRGLLQQSGIPG